MKFTRTPQSPKPNHFKPRWVSNHLLVVLFIAAALLFAGAGYWFYSQQAQAIHNQKTNELKSIASLKVQQIVQWRQERLIDARMNSSSPFFAQAIDQWLSDPNNVPLKTELIKRLQMIVDLQGYQNVLLTDAEGKLLLSVDPGVTSLEAETQKLVAQASAGPEIRMGDLVRNAVSGKITLAIAAPVLDGQNLPAAVLVFQIDPGEYLYPFIQSWPIPSESAETLLIQKEGADALYLNTLRFRTDPPMTIRIPLTQADIPSVQAALGRTGMIEGKDYRGVEVLAEILPVPGTPWLMEAKVDRHELLAAINSLGLAVLMVVLLSVLMTALTAAYTFNQRHRVLLHSLLEEQQERLEAQEETRTTLYSIGDGVICTDSTGFVTRLNPIAEALTGWSEAEAQGKPLAQVFHIISEATRLRVENPVDLVLREGRIVGLANHTLLIHRDGTEHPIADSSAPIRNAAGEITGVVLVFRDQTQERAVQRERALLNYTISSSLNEIYLFDAQTLRFRFVNDGAAKNLGYSLEQLRSMTPLDIKPEFTTESFKQKLQPLLNHSTPALTFETVHQRADGSRYPVEVHLQLFEYEGEQVFLAVINDITERRQAEKALRENEARLEDAQAMAHMGNWEIHLGEKVLWASQEAFRIYGLENTSSQIPLALAQQIVAQEDRPRLDEALDNLIHQQGKYDVQFRIRRANDGAVRTIHSVARLEIDEQGAPFKVIGVMQDITEVKKIEEELRESENRYRTIFQSSQAVILLIDPEDGSLLDANPAAVKFYGWTREELLNMKISQINTLPPEVIQHEMDLARSEKRNYFQFQHRNKEGLVRDVEVSSGPIEINGKILLFSLVLDVTDRKKAEAKVEAQLAELRRWQKVTLGREDRVLELKREVNELLIQAGLPPRYSSPDSGESQ